jgi:hypothetical protein
MASTSGTGPWGWENARAKLAGEPWASALEIACYTDARCLDGDVASGPYTAMVPLAFPKYQPEQFGEPRMGLVIRIDRHLSIGDPGDYIDEAWNQSDEKVAHGGDAGEELAALLSLALGIRLRAGGISRVFHPDDPDDRGYPHQVERAAPYLPQPARRPMLPYTMIRPVMLEAATAFLDIYPRLSPKQALGLVRAARSYQDALWIADSDPRLAWLRLVSAIEAVAQLPPNGQVEQTLTATHPEIAQRLSNADDPELTRLVTKLLVQQGRATAKFLGFLKAYGPRRPDQRPERRYQINWNELQDQLRAVYGYRSSDLHSGIPIPWVMCEPPFLSRAGRAPERVWVPADWQGRVPMHLHMFEFLVRKSLQAWWRSLGS